MENAPVRSTSELARRLGLSRWTVSRALNGHADVSEETAIRVRAAARDLRFEPNVFGVGLRSGRMNWVGVGLPDLVDYFLTTKLRRLQEAVREQGARVDFEIMEPSAEGERAVIEHFASTGCAAVVLVASRLAADDAAFARLAGNGVRLVRIDPMFPGTAWEVSTDRAHAMRAAILRLHRYGHRRIAVVGVNEETPYGRQRVAGIRRACGECGLNYGRDIRFFLDDAADAEDDFARGAEAAAAVVKARREGFTAVLALNDRMAVGLLRGLAGTRLRVPRDLSLVGYDDADFGRYSSPPISTIDPGVEELIAHAVTLLRAPTDAPRRLKVRPRLIERASLGAAPRGLGGS